MEETYITTLVAAKPGTGQEGQVGGSTGSYGVKRFTARGQGNRYQAFSCVASEKPGWNYSQPSWKCKVDFLLEYLAHNPAEITGGIHHSGLELRGCCDFSE